VWLEPTPVAGTGPTLREGAREVHKALHDMCPSAVLFVAERARVVPDVVMKTDRLHALVDGLAVHGTLYPRFMPRTRMRAAVHAHLHSLWGSREGTRP
jgi:BetI-type transcriptional repressor, C-terminal